MIGEQQKPIIIGSPLVKGATVTAEILRQARDPKIIVFKKKRRHNYRRKNGHRQNVTHVLIKEIRKA
jgi:large subunit ribosomal protein L21